MHALRDCKGWLCGPDFLHAYQPRRHPESPARQHRIRLLLQIQPGPSGSQTGDRHGALQVAPTPRSPRGRWTNSSRKHSADWRRIRCGHLSRADRNVDIRGAKLPRDRLSTMRLGGDSRMAALHVDGAHDLPESDWRHHANSPPLIYCASKRRSGSLLPRSPCAFPESRFARVRSTCDLTGRLRRSKGRRSGCGGILGNVGTTEAEGGKRAAESVSETAYPAAGSGEGSGFPAAPLTVRSESCGRYSTASHRCSDRDVLPRSFPEQMGAHQGGHYLRCSNGQEDTARSHAPRMGHDPGKW